MLPADERPAAETHQREQGQVPLLVLDHGHRRRAVPCVRPRSPRLVQGAGGDGMRGVPGRNLFALAGLAGFERGFPGAGQTAHRPHQEGVRGEAHGVPQHGADLFGRDRRDGGRHGLPHDAGRRRQARAGLEVAQLRLCQRHRPEAAPAAAQLQALGRHRVPLFEQKLGPVAADGGQIRAMALFGRDAGRGGEPVHGLRDLRRTPDRRHGHLRIHARASQSGSGQEKRPGIRHGDRSGEEIPAGART